jgi:hypothetical protein
MVKPFDPSATQLQKQEMVRHRKLKILQKSAQAVRMLRWLVRL